MVHINESRYWSTLLDEPESHDKFLVRCNLHLVYIGKGIYAQLVPRLELMDYAIFGIEQQQNVDSEMKPLIVGSLTTDENETLEHLLSTGIRSKSSQEHNVPSASAGSEMEIPRVEKELRSSLRLSGLPTANPSMLTSHTYEHVFMEPSTAEQPSKVLSETVQHNKELVLKVELLSAEEVKATIATLRSKSKKQNKKS